jgi:hypothetical protein
LINAAWLDTLVNLMIKRLISLASLSVLLLIFLVKVQGSDDADIDFGKMESQFGCKKVCEIVDEEFSAMSSNLLGVPLFEIQACLRRLVGNGVDITLLHLKPNEWNILHEAVYSDNLLLARLLLEEFRMDPNAWNPYFGTCVYLVTSADMVALLKEFSANFACNRGCALYPDGPEESARMRNNFAFFTHRDDFVLRAETLYAKLNANQKEVAGRGRIKFSGSRNNIYVQALKQFTTYFNCELVVNLPTADIYVKYTKESGLDYGGLTAEFISTIFSEFLKPGRVFVSDPESGKLVFWEKAAINQVQFAGYVVGLSLYHRVPLNGVRFAPIFYHLLCAHNIERDVNFVSVIRETSEDALRSFEAIKSLSSGDLQGFPYPYPEPSREDDSRPWKKLRREDEPLASKAEISDYIREHSRHLVYRAKEPLFRAFLFGVSRAIDYRLIRPLLVPQELQLILEGESDFTVADWIANCANEPENQLIGWLNEIVGEFDAAQRMKLLKFFTALDALPIGGLGALDPAMQVEIISGADGSDELLPEAATCFNTLKLYNYSSKAVLKTRLLVAIDNCGGFYKK